MLDLVFLTCFSFIGEDSTSGRFQISPLESDISLSSSAYFSHLAIKGVQMFDMLASTWIIEGSPSITLQKTTHLASNLSGLSQIA